MRPLEQILEEFIEACFRSIWGSTLHKIYHRVDIDTSLKPGCVSFYIKFLQSILGKDNFKFRLLKGNEILFILYAGKINHIKNLAMLHVTLFRYIQEFPEIVLALYKACKNEKDIEVKLHKFYNLHYDDLDRKYRNLSGHGIASLYGTKNDKLSLKNFQTKIKNSSPSIQSFFR